MIFCRHFQDCRRIARILLILYVPRWTLLWASGGISRSGLSDFPSEITSGTRSGKRGGTRRSEPMTTLWCWQVPLSFIGQLTVLMIVDNGDDGYSSVAFTKNCRLLRFIVLYYYWYRLTLIMGIWRIVVVVVIDGLFHRNRPAVLHYDILIAVYVEDAKHHGSCIVCRYYLYLYSHWLPQPLRDLVTQLDNCDDILINFITSHVTQRPPIRVARRPGRHGNAEWFLSVSEASSYPMRHYCMRKLTQQFGYMPLMRSSVRFEPLLYRDPVSIFRKKYRQMQIGGLWSLWSIGPKTLDMGRDGFRVSFVPLPPIFPVMCMFYCVFEPVFKYDTLWRLYCSWRSEA